MRYHIVPQLNCVNLMHGETHLANIMQNRDTAYTRPETHGRWFYHGRNGLEGTCHPDGYATFEDAVEAATETHTNCLNGARKYYEPEKTFAAILAGPSDDME